jgi:hypothetical protein
LDRIAENITFFPTGNELQENNEIVVMKTFKAAATTHVAFQGQLPYWTGDSMHEDLTTGRAVYCHSKHNRMCGNAPLSGNDHEPPIFVGPGHNRYQKPTDIDFAMFATPPMKMMLSVASPAHAKPYEVFFDQFRLFATDYQGSVWA